MLVGCSYDPIEDALIEAVPSEQKEKSFQINTIHAKEKGKIWIMVSDECPNYELMILQGYFSDEYLGPVRTWNSICGDKDYVMNSIYEMENGDRLYYRSIGTAVDNIGLHFRMELVKGDGLYANTTSKLKIYFDEGIFIKREGEYYNKIEGKISTEKQ